MRSKILIEAPAARGIGIAAEAGIIRKEWETIEAGGASPAPTGETLGSGEEKAEM